MKPYAIVKLIVKQMLYNRQEQHLDFIFYYFCCYNHFFTEIPVFTQIPSIFSLIDRLSNKPLELLEVRRKLALSIISLPQLWKTDLPNCQNILEGSLKFPCSCCDIISITKSISQNQVIETNPSR